MSKITDPVEKQSPPLIDASDEKLATSKWQKLLIVCATLLALFAICAIAVRLGMAIHHTLLLFALGGLVAYALDPLVELLRRPKFGKNQKSLSRGLSVLSVFLGMFLVFSLGIWWLGGQAVGQFKLLQEDAPQYRTRALDLARNFDEQVLKPRNIAFSTEETIKSPPPEVNKYAEQASKQALPFVAHTASDIGESVVVLLIALYFLIFASDLKEKANAALSPLVLTYAVPWETDVNRILGGFVRGQLILAVITGAAAALGLLVIGVHLWLLIGLFVVAASLIPVFGPYLAAVPAVIAALIGPTHMSPVGGAVAVAVFFIVINEAGSKVLYPKLVGKALNLHEVVVLFVLFAGLEVGGIIGTLFAAPATSLMMVSLIHLYRLWQGLPEVPVGDEVAGSSEKGRGQGVFKVPKLSPKGE